MRIKRRDFIRMTAAQAGYTTLAGLRLAAKAPDPYDTLIQGQYANDVQFIRQAGGLYLGDNFTLTSSPFTWTLRLGRYQGRYNGHPVDIHGYWIFKKNAKMAWQAENRGNGRLRYWNQDGHAAGNPEDWELFTIFPVKKQDHSVIIANASYMEYMRWSTGHLPTPSEARNYVNLVGNQFSCADTADNAAVLIVQFV